MNEGEVFEINKACTGGIIMCKNGVKVKSWLIKSILFFVFLLGITTTVAASDVDDNPEIPIEGFAGENVSANEIITAMDENENIYELDTEDAASYLEMGIMPFANGDPFYVNFNTKASNETTSYKEVGTNIEGYVCGDYGADAIYLGTVNGQIKFMLSGVIGLVDADEVELVSRENAVSYSYYTVKSGRLRHYITTNMYASSYANNLNNGYAPSYLQSGVKYYSYDGHYFYTEDKLSLMVSDYNAGHRNNSVNSTSPYYNYYQYLPFRSYSLYSADELTTIINNRIASVEAEKQVTSKLRDLGDDFVSMQNTYGTNALLVAAVAANESAWGTSNICRTKNNLFGINAVDATPGQSANYYPDAETCVKDFTETLLSKQYLNPENWKYRGAFLGNKASGANLNYASDPYWGEKIASIAWSLDENGGCKDELQYTIGIKNTICSDHTNLNVRKEASTSSTSLYKTKAQSNHAFLILDPTPVNDFYMVQSDPVLTSGRSSVASGTGVYDKYSMYAYASSNYITIVSEGKNKYPLEKEPELLSLKIVSNNNGYYDLDVNYISNGQELEFRWYIYNHQTGKFEDIVGWNSSSSAVWKAERGNYGLICELRSKDGKYTDQLMNWYVRYAFDNFGTYAGGSNGGILLGCNSPVIGATYYFKIYNLDTKQWEWGSEQPGVWAMWYPPEGNYWTHFEVYSADGRLIGQKTYCFAVQKWMLS